MPATSRLGLRYPTSGDATTLWTYFQNLANDVEAKASQSLGVSSSFPSASVVADGDSFYHSVLRCAFRRVSTNWRAITVAFGNSSELAAAQAMDLSIVTGVLLFHNSTTGDMWRYFSGTWTAIVYNSGWQPIAPQSGWTEVGSDSGYRIVNGMCSFIINHTRATTWTAGANIARIGIEARPTRTFYYPGFRSGSVITEIKVGSDGFVVATLTGTAGNVNASGTFPVG